MAHEQGGDPRRVRQIRLKLLFNALMFGAGHPEFVRCTRAAAGGIGIEVSDHGPGIGPEQSGVILEGFVQLDTSSSVQGTGSGLPIARRLARLIGGSPDAVSTPGVGSAFRLVLPHRPPRTPAGGPSPDHRGE